MLRDTWIPQNVLFIYFFDLSLSPALSGLCSAVRILENLAKDSLPHLKVFMKSLTPEETRSHVPPSVTNHCISRTFSHVFLITTEYPLVRTNMHDL